jgi:hypothetical protein
MTAHRRAILKTQAAVLVDLHHRNGRLAKYNLAGSCLPFDFESFHLLSAISHDAVLALAQTEPLETRSPRNPIHTCS